MESRRSRTRKPLLAFLAVALLLILQPASAVPTSRSLHLMRSQQQQHPPSLQLSPQEMSLGRVAARMDVEVVNDYPGSGANNRHDPPKGP